MSDESKNIDFVLGQVSGKLDGIANSITSITSTFTAHALSDEKHFADLRQQMEKDKEEANKDRVKVAKFVGGTVVVATILSYLVPNLINRF